VKARKLQQENVTPQGEVAPVSRFIGKEEDVEVGLQYLGKRFLSPYLGRWISADPLAVHVPGSADLNLYAYVHGRLLRAVDPVGLETYQNEYGGQTTVTQGAAQGTNTIGEVKIEVQVPRAAPAIADAGTGGAPAVGPGPTTGGTGPENKEPPQRTLEQVILQDGPKNFYPETVELAGKFVAEGELAVLLPASRLRGPILLIGGGLLTGSRTEEEAKIGALLMGPALAPGATSTTQEAVEEAITLYRGINVNNAKQPQVGEDSRSDCLNVARRVRLELRVDRIHLLGGAG